MCQIACRGAEDDWEHMLVKPKIFTIAGSGVIGEQYRVENIEERPSIAEGKDPVVKDGGIRAGASNYGP